MAKDQSLTYSAEHAIYKAGVGDGFQPAKEGEMPQPTKLYWAYGSNLNKAQMLHRCPAAVPLEALTVENLVLRFRGVADVAYRTGSRCEGALWAITRDCERALDSYEGVGAGGFGGLYRKCYFDYVDPDSGETHKVLYYKMNRSGIMPPGERYLDCIIAGYADFGIDATRLKNAVEHAWRRKDLTNNFMRHRWEKAGRPKMARPERIAIEDTTGSDEPQPLISLADLDEGEAPPVEMPVEKLSKKALKKRPVREEPLPDVCLRSDPQNGNYCRAVTVTERGESYFTANIKAVKDATEWCFKFSTHVVAGLLQKKGLTVAILEKLGGRS